MKPLSINMSHFEKIGGDKDHTLMRHRQDGHEIKINHKPLSKKMQAEFKALPMAEGGGVQKPKPDPSPEPSPAPEVSDTRKDFAKKFRQGSGFAEGGKVPHYADGTGNVQKEPDTADKIVADAATPQQAPIENIPQEPNKYAQAYQQRLEFQNQFTPGEPQAAKEQQAIDFAQRLKGSDQAEQAWQKKDAEVQTARQQAIDAQKQSLGIQTAGTQGVGQPLPIAVTPTPGAATPNNIDTTKPPQNPVADPWGTEAQASALAQGIGEEKTGRSNEAEHLGALGNAQAQDLQKMQEQQQRALVDYKRNYDKITQSVQGLQQAINDQHIDPNHYVNSMSTGSQIGTMIGLVLGGLSAGMSHQPNMALDYFNKQIDKDIDAQKAELGKKQNLLSANMLQYGNLRDAMDATRMQQMTIIANQLQQSAAKSAGPLAKDRALQEIGKIDQTMSATAGQLAMRRSVMNGDPNDPNRASKVINFFLPQGEREGANKELNDANGMLRARDNLLGAIEKVGTLNTLSNRVGHPLNTQSEINSAWDPIITGISKETAGRLTEQDIGLLNALKPKISDGPNQIQQKQRDAAKLINEKANFSKLDAYNINPFNSNAGSRYGDTGEKRIQMSPPVKK